MQLLHNKSVIHFFLVFYSLCTLSSGEPFPVPEILKDNIVFWKKIYTEVSVNEGLLHDFEYPLIIYKKISLPQDSRRHRRRKIAKEKERIKALLETIDTEPESSWSKEAQEIAALFNKYAPQSALKEARDRIRFQRGQMERFKKGLYRSGAYLDSIRVILARYNVPLRLAYLPHVESSFLTNAYSHVGAAGLWQFMRGTGRLYMTINYSIDERRDPILSTYAAAKLLSHNYNQLQSWPLAVTAYNHGLNGMKRAVKQTGSRDIAVIIENYKGRLFKFASKNFYSCFLAASDIAKSPEKYFPDITFAPPLQYQDITLKYYIKPHTLASFTGIARSDLERLNPAIRPVVFQQNKLIPKGTTIHIPLSVSRVAVNETLNNLPDSLKILTPPRPKYYKVRRGDNLYAIARRFKISARGLALENNITRMNRIYAGQILRIPEGVGVSGEMKQPPVQVVMVQDRKKTAKRKVHAETKEKKQESIPDTLNEILSAEAEQVPESKMFVKSRHSSKFDAEVYNLDINYIPEEHRATIFISVDETIGHYADWLGIATQRIREINYMGRRSSIHIHQKLSIPIAGTESLDQFVQRRLEYHMALEEDFYTQFKVTDLKAKIIKSGDNLWGICNENGVIPLWLLKKYNKHIDIMRLYPAMQIWLPEVEQKTELDFKQEANAEKEEWRGTYPSYSEPFLQPIPLSLFP